MKVLKVLVFNVLLMTATLNLISQNNDTLIIKFRKVPISNGLSIELGEKINTLKNAVVKISKNNYYLKKGTFGGADSITISTNNNLDIISASFFYDSTFTYKKQIEVFTEFLGKGNENIKNEFQYQTTWEDILSIFEVVYNESKKGHNVFSILIDKVSKKDN